MLVLDSTRQIYRGARPTVPELLGAGIKGVVDLEPVRLEEHEKTALAASGIEVSSVPMSAFFPPRLSQVRYAVRQLLILAKLGKAPVLLHCREGRDRSGVVAAAYRCWCMNWQPKFALAEMFELGFHARFIYWLPFIKRILRSPSPIVT